MSPHQQSTVLLSPTSKLHWTQAPLTTTTLDSLADFNNGSVIIGSAALKTPSFEGRYQCCYVGLYEFIPSGPQTPLTQINHIDLDAGPIICSRFKFVWVTSHKPTVSKLQEDQAIESSCDMGQLARQREKLHFQHLAGPEICAFKEPNSVTKRISPGGGICPKEQSWLGGLGTGAAA